MYRVQKDGRDLGYLKGQVDLLFCDQKSRWVLVDYKTAEKEEAEHTHQMLLYAFCLRRLFDGKPDEVFLYYSKKRLFKAVSLEPLLTTGFEAGMKEDYESLQQLVLKYPKREVKK